MRSRSREDGFTLLEAAIVFVVVTGLTAMITQSLISLSRSQRWSERRSVALNKVEKLVQAMSQDLEAGVRVYTESPTSRRLLGWLDLGPMAPSQSTVLPIATERGFFDVDAMGVRETGNMLLIARTLPAIEVPTGVADRRARIDRYQFVLYCLHRDNDRLDLDRWASAPIARVEDIAAIPDAVERGAVVAGLHAQGVPLAWRRDEPVVENAFFHLLAGGRSPRMQPPAKIPSSAHELVRDPLLRSRLMVASNGSAGSDPVPRYAHELPNYPHGFEVKIDGDGTGRLVLVRLVVVSAPAVGERPVRAAVERLISVREP
ncbi:MAG: type II secretion system protein J [Planctomycetota bacterium]